MAIETTESKTVYSNASTLEYPIPWPFFDDDDIVVVIGRGGTETTLTPGMDYSIVPAATGSQGGTLHLTAAPATGNDLVVLRQMPLVQLTRLPLSGKLDTEAVERQFDRTIMVVQQLAEEVSRCIKVPVTEYSGDYYTLIMGAKNVCLDCADICATNAQTCAAVERNISLVWAELTGNVELANGALLTLKEAAEATGAVRAAVEAGKAGINEASAAALTYARGQVDEAKVQAVGTLSLVAQTENDRLTALISEAVGADGAVTAAKNAAQAAATQATDAVNGIDAKTASSLASLEAAQGVAQGFLNTALEKAQAAVDSAGAANSQSLAALTEIRDSIAAALGHKNAAGSSAAAALKSAQDAALDKSKAEAAALAATNTSQIVANASIVAHNASPQAHQDIRTLATTVNGRVATLEGDLLARGIYPMSKYQANVDFNTLWTAGNYLVLGSNNVNAPIGGNGTLIVSRYTSSGGDVTYVNQLFFHRSENRTFTRRMGNTVGWTDWAEMATVDALNSALDDYAKKDMTNVTGALRLWESGAKAIPSASLVLNHNLNLTAPRTAIASLTLICKTANNGYAVGDVVQPGGRATSSADTPFGFYPALIVTQNSVRFQLPRTVECFYIIPKGDPGGYVYLFGRGNTEWDLNIRIIY